MKNSTKLQIISLANGLTFYTAIFTLFLLQRGFSLGFIVAAQTVFNVGMLLSVVPTGIFADKFGQKLAIQLSIIIDVLTMLALLITHTPLALILFFGIRGVSVGFRSGSDEALLYDSHIEENGTADGYSKAYGRLIASEALGFVIATTLAGIAVQLFGASSYQPLIILSAATSVVGLVIAAFLRQPKHIKAHDHKSNMFQQLKQGVGTIKKNHVLFALMIAGMLTLNGEYLLRQTYQPYFQSMMVPAIFLGLALSMGKLLNVVAMRNVHRLEKHLTVDQIFLGLNLVLASGYIVMAFAPSALILVASFILIQTMLNLQRPIFSDYINEQIGPQQRSTTLSAMSFVDNITQIVVRILLGAAIGIIGLNNTFALQGFYLLIGVTIGVWYLRRCGCVNRTHHSADTAEIEPLSIA
jgi:MFS family permease